MDRSMNLDELEGFAWGEPKYSTSLARRCHELRRTPVGEMTPGDLRVLIDQQIGLDHVVELAVEALERDPFVECDDYAGDLLCAVLGVEPRFWASRRDLLLRLDAVLGAVGARLAHDDAPREPDAYPLTDHESMLLRAAIKTFAARAR